MKKLIHLCGLAIAGLLSAGDRLFRGPRYEFSNIAEGTYPTGCMTRLADVALTRRHLLVKIGTDINHIAINTASDIPLGVADDEAAAAEDDVNVQLLGQKEGTVLMVAGAAITAGAFVVGTAAGKVITLPATTGTYYIVGRALEAAGADLDVINVAHCFPILRVVA
jgi:hypothetical protein